MLFSINDKPYVAIIGDIIGSRNIENRNEVQNKLKDVLNHVNNKYAEDISAKFTITLGDEFQGLLSAGRYVMDIIQFIERKMYPVKMRFGVGIGKITTDIHSDLAIGSDGPAYYLARNMINELKLSEKKNKSPKSNIKVTFENQNNIEALLNTTLALCTVIKNSWTDRQRTVVYDYMEFEDQQKNMASRLGITQSSVQKSIAASNLYNYLDAMNTISKILSEIGEKDDV